MYMSQPIVQEIFFWLQFSSLVLVHLLLLILIVVIIKLAFAILRLIKNTESAVDQVKDKSLDLIETSQETAFNISDLLNVVLDLASYRKRKGVFQIFTSFFRK